MDQTLDSTQTEYNCGNETFQDEAHKTESLFDPRRIQPPISKKEVAETDQQTNETIDHHFVSTNGTPVKSVADNIDDFHEPTQFVTNNQEANEILSVTSKEISPILKRNQK